MIEFDRIGDPLSEPSLKQFEEKLGAKLPDEYRRFLIISNGGTPSDDLSFSFIEEGVRSESVLSEFYSIAMNSDRVTLYKVLDTFVRRRRVPAGLLPIADDAFGNQICISLAKENFGWIYFWDHEMEPENINDYTSQNVSLISKSFDEFVNGLVQCKD